MSAGADVFITDGTVRIAAVRNLFEQTDLFRFSGKSVAIKANFNSADPFPATTHIDTLGAIRDALARIQPSRMVLVERSGMRDTRNVLEQTGVFDLARDRDLSITVLDEVDRSGWQEIQASGLHWSRGFFPRRTLPDLTA